MELRQLRYFIAVAETGSLTLAAERRLHTSQPSLSRQIRDLEDQVGVPLFSRSARGVVLIAAGKAFIDHARLALAQVDAAVEAARRAAQPAKQRFAMGFLTGQEMTWLPRAMHILREELPNVDVTVSSDYSPDLAEGLVRGTVARGDRANNQQIRFFLGDTRDSAADSWQLCGIQVEIDPILHVFFSRVTIYATCHATQSSIASHP